MADRIFLLLGSNQADPEKNLAEARRHLGSAAGDIISTSSQYLTAPWGDPDQPDFYNQVVEIQTALQPRELLDVLLDIENRMGRLRTRKWGPRIIDIDILLYGSEVIDLPGLIIPHPGMAQRMFTLLPLAEIGADVLHPVTGKKIAVMLAECRDPLPVTRL